MRYFFVGNDNKWRLMTHYARDLTSTILELNILPDSQDMV